MESRLVEMGVGNWMLDALFPRFCLRCEKERTVWCAPCDAAWVPAAPQAGCPFCGEGSSSRTCVECGGVASLDGLVSAMQYGDPIVRRGIGAWKYECDEEAKAMIARWVSRSPALPALPFRPDAVTHVPLSLRRLRSRGFDQAEGLARQVADMLGVPFVPLIERTLHGSPRAKVGRSDRKLGDLDGVFRARSASPARVLLCDDVFTSGATLDAAARALKRAGATEVWGFAIAKG